MLEFNLTSWIQDWEHSWGGFENRMKVIGAMEYGIRDVGYEIRTMDRATRTLLPPWHNKQLNWLVSSNEFTCWNFWLSVGMDLSNTVPLITSLF